MGRSVARTPKAQVDWRVQSPVRQSRLGDQLYEQILEKIVSSFGLLMMHTWVTVQEIVLGFL